MMAHWGVLLISLASIQGWGQSRFGGSLQGYYRQYAFSSSEESANAAGGFNGNLKFDWKSKPVWRFKSDLEFQTDQVSKDSAEKFRFNPRTLYIENKSASVVFRAGYQTIIPEGPDFLNLADVIHSKDWKDPTSPRSLGSAGLSISQEGSTWQWEAFYIPLQTKPRLPGDQSPWWPRGQRIPIESNDTEFQVPADIKYDVTDGEDINHSLNNNYALRLGGKAASFEGQLIFYEGLAQDPNVVIDSSGTLLALTPKLILLLNSPVTLKPLFFKHRALAGTFVLPLETWSIKGGASLTKPISDDPRVPGEVVSGVLGFEKNFDTSKGLVTFIAQHEAQKRGGKNQISFLKSIYENAWSVGLRIPWGEDLQLLAGVIYDTLGKSSLIRLGTSFRWNDSVSLEIDGQALQGPEETLLGLYNKYDSVSLGLTYHF